MSDRKIDQDNLPHTLRQFATAEERKKKNEEYLAKMRTLSMDEAIMNEIILCFLPGELDTPYDTLQMIIQWHVDAALYFERNPVEEELSFDISENESHSGESSEG